MWSLKVINDHKSVVVHGCNTINDHMIFPVIKFSTTEQYVVVGARVVTTTFLITTTNR